MWLQQYGATPHYALILRAFLNDHYNNRWIGQSGLVAWPPCSPDLTWPDCYSWGYLKNIVFAQRTTTRQDLMERIHRACTSIPRATLLNTVHYFEKRFLCLETNRGNFKQLHRAWMIVTVRDRRTHNNIAPQTWEARGLTITKQPKENRIYYPHVVVCGKR